MQWHQLDRMQTICTSRQTPTPHNSFFTGRMLFLTPNQRCQSIEGMQSTVTTLLLILWGTLKLQDWTLQNWTLTDDFAGVDIAGLDNGGPDIDGLNIAGLDFDGRMCEQLTELKLQNFIDFIV